MPPGCPSLDTRMQAAMSGIYPPTSGLTGLKPDGIAIGSPREKCSASGPSSSTSSQKSRERANTRTKKVSGDLFNDMLVFMTCRLLHGRLPALRATQLCLFCLSQVYLR